MSDYRAFLEGKVKLAPSSGFTPGALPPELFDYQAHCADFALRQGRSGVYLDTGLGKSAIQLAFLQQAAAKFNGMALLLAPLAVAWQLGEEAERFGIEARVVREQSECGPGVNIINYDRLEKIDPQAFGAVSLDEASILKSFNGKTTRALINAFAPHRFKMTATATPAPNDHMELGQQCEFLSVMQSNEMLMRWFVADQTHMGRYRLKGHGARAFWDWMAGWSRMAENPADLGFDGSRFVLPTLNVVYHHAQTDTRPTDGALFADLVSATTMHDIKRQTAEARAELASGIAATVKDAVMIWCDTDYEADSLKAAIPQAVEVRGSHSIERKEETLRAFASGEVRILISKPSICGHGLNWQHCNQMVFAGRSFSYESWYQAVRRCWRFGQKRPVTAHVIVAEGEQQIAQVISRKADDHATMKAEMVAAMRRAMGTDRKQIVNYNPKHKGRLPQWLSAA